MVSTHILICVVLLTRSALAVQLHLEVDVIRVKNFQLSKCDNKQDPITLKDISLDVAPNKKLMISGTLSTDINLISPITANVKLRRRFGVWINVPCKHNLGSCTYNDLCLFGYPANKPCPQKFIQNKIPCRCPLPKGTYTLPKTIALSSSFHSIWDGKYRATVMITTKGLRLACYNANFEIVDGSENSIYGNYYIEGNTTRV